MHLALAAITATLSEGDTKNLAIPQPVSSHSTASSTQHPRPMTMLRSPSPSDAAPKSGAAETCAGSGRGLPPWSQPISATS